MRSWIESFRSSWKNLRASDKGWFLAAVVLLALIGTGEMILHHGKPEVTTLFGNLDAQDEAAVTAYLRTNGIPYGIRGNALFVRSDMADSLRAQIAERNILEGSREGNRLLDKASLGITDRIQDLNVTRAIEGEIANTLRQMSFVREASVRIQPEEESLYGKNQKPAKATVLLRLREGCQPTPSQIDTVANFVSGAHTRLRPDQVFIADENGTVLNSTNSSACGEPTRAQCIFGGR